jgi:hypothetical protein
MLPLLLLLLLLFDTKDAGCGLTCLSLVVICSANEDFS